MKVRLQRRESDSIIDDFFVHFEQLPVVGDEIRPYGTVSDLYYKLEEINHERFAYPVLLIGPTTPRKRVLGG